MEGLAVAFAKKAARFERIVSSERRWQRATVASPDTTGRSDDTIVLVVSALGEQLFYCLNRTMVGNDLDDVRISDNV